MKAWILSFIGLIIVGCNNGDEGLLGKPPTRLNDIVALNISPQLISIPKGLDVQFKATATLSNGQTLEVTDQAALNWQSSDTAIATVDTSGVATGLAVGRATITASGQVNGQSFTASAALDVTDAVLLSISVSPNPVEVNVFSSRPLIALGYYSDNSEVLVTSQVSWLGQDTAIAVVQARSVTGVQEGTTETIAFFNSVTSDPVPIEVLEPTLKVCGNVDGFPIDDSPTGGINNRDQTNAIGYCLKVRGIVDPNGGGTQWFTSTPSKLVMDRLGYTIDDSETNSNDTYAALINEDGTTGPIGEFARFRQDGIGVDIPGENGQLDRWCQKLSTLSFAGKNGWRRATESELSTLFSVDNDENASFYDSWGWPTLLRYTSSTLNGSNLGYMLVSLRNGSLTETSRMGKHYASCVINMQ